ncbi:MAG: serine/threonine protein kinase [Myxococcales bacterium]|nr:serine/threonine protein kinase [Myxococcales bacterium]
MTTQHFSEGHVLGKYRIEKVVGGGGQATVYKALHLDFQNPVALKVVNSKLTESSAIRERFKREARLQFQLQHPHIVRVFDILEEEETLIMVMDWVEGDDLEHFLQKRQGPLRTEEIERFFLPVLQALSYAHQKKIIHRDLKPSNILLEGPSGHETPKVMDFGIAKSLEDDNQHTKTNALLGTPHYIAPEHASSSKYVDHRVDIYALGVTLYQLLSGHLPFAGGDLVQIITAHLTQDPPPIADWGVQVAPELEQIARKAMQKRPQDRFQSCEDFAHALRAAIQGDPETLQKYLGPADQAPFHAVPSQSKEPLPTGEMDAYPDIQHKHTTLTPATSTPNREETTPQTEKERPLSPPQAQPKRSPIWIALGLWCLSVRVLRDLVGFLPPNHLRKTRPLEESGHFQDRRNGSHHKHT